MGGAETGHTKIVLMRLLYVARARARHVREHHQWVFRCFLEDRSTSRNSLKAPPEVSPSASVASEGTQKSFPTVAE